MGAQPIAAEPDTLRRHQGLAGRQLATAGLGLGAALGAAHASEQAGDARVAAQAMREGIGGQRQGRGRRRLEQGHIAFGQGLKGRTVSLDSIDTNTLERAAKDRLHGGLPTRLDLQGVDDPRPRIELLAAQKLRHALAIGARFGGLLQGLQRRAPPALHLQRRAPLVELFLGLAARVAQRAEVRLEFGAARAVPRAAALGLAQFVRERGNRTQGLLVGVTVALLLQRVQTATQALQGVLQVLNTRLLNLRFATRSGRPVVEIVPARLPGLHGALGRGQRLPGGGARRAARVEIGA